MNNDVAAIFDLDKTIIATSASLALRVPMRRTGLASRRKVLVGVVSQLSYLFFGAGHERTERMKDTLAALSKGVDAKELEEVTQEAFGNYITPVCYGRSLDLIQLHKAAGHNVVIASASAEEMVRPIAKMLGVQYCLGTQMEVENKQFTGVVNKFLYAEQKAEAVKELAELKGWDLSKSYAYSDSITDLPLLELVGNPFAVNPDKKLREIAVERNWSILEYSDTVEVRSLHKKIAYPGVASLAVLALGYLAFKLLKNNK